MNILLRNFRQWWQPPRNIRDRPEHRQVTFLELFYDLVYVVLIAELTHSLARNVDLQHIGNFAFLFVIVWWAWVNGTAYHEIHGNNDIRTRVFTFLQMFSVAAMAIFAHDALGDTSVGFALSYAAFQIILTYMWWRTGFHDPNHRPLSRPYTTTFMISTFLFIISIFVAPPVRFYMWGFATMISVLLPILTSGAGRNNPDVQEQINMSRQATPSFIERFDLLTIIVLGEVIVGVVRGIAEHQDLTLEVGIIGGLGMVIAIGLWWLYFDFVSHRKPIEEGTWLIIWLYAHLPLTAGIAVVGAAVLNVVEHAGEQLPIEVRWLLIGAITIVLITIVLLIQALQSDDAHHRTYHSGQIATLVAAIVIIGLGFSSLQIIPLLIAIIVLMLAPIFFALIFWVREFEHQLSSDVTPT